MRFLVVSSMLAACASPPPGDVTGPFRGPVTRLVVDRFVLPASNASARALGDDLDGDAQVDNRLGMVIGALALNGDLTPYADDQLAAGAIASSIELQAEDLARANRAAATYFGSDGADAAAAGGTIVDGAFVSNRTRATHVRAQASIVLPIFADADASTVGLDALELDLTPDGAGGYDALVRGGIVPDDAWHALYVATQQIIERDPDAHYAFAALVDADRDGAITLDELERSDLFSALLAPDIQLFGEPRLSIGFGAHLVPCANGTCPASLPLDRCHDRMQDGNETGIDCGGDCIACPVANPTCSDGIRDGLETDVDCGWNCAPCAGGKHCASGLDCVSGNCVPDLAGAALGSCYGP